MKKRSLYNIWGGHGAGSRAGILAICISLWGFHAGAQGVFTYKAALDTITKDAFYEIDLPPALVAKCRRDLGDLRILGPGKKFVAYVLKNPSTTAAGDEICIPLPGAVMVQKDSSDRHSYLTIEYPEAYQIDWLAFVIRSPVYFRRTVQVSAAGANPGEWVRLDDLVLDPKHFFFKITNVKTRQLRIDIANKDNTPLVINEVPSFQSARNLLAYLQAGSVYEVVAGNAQATAPEYDLKYFTDSVHGTLRELAPGPVERLDSADQAVLAGMEPAHSGQSMQPGGTENANGRNTKAGGRNRSGLLLWGSLLIVLLVLVYFSIRMVRAIAQKDKHDRL